MRGRTPEEAISRIESICDFSNLPPQHPLFSEKNKSTVGFFKDELRMKQTVEEACLVRSKCYSLKLRSRDGELSDDVVNKCKGVRKGIVKRIPFDAYKEVLLNTSSQSGVQNVIRSSNHQVYTVAQEKKFFSAFEDKTYLL